MLILATPRLPAFHQMQCTLGFTANWLSIGQKALHGQAVKAKQGSRTAQVHNAQAAGCMCPGCCQNTDADAVSAVWVEGILAMPSEDMETCKGMAGLMQTTI